MVVVCCLPVLLPLKTSVSLPLPVMLCYYYMTATAHHTPSDNSTAVGPALARRTPQLPTLCNATGQMPRRSASIMHAVERHKQSIYMHIHMAVSRRKYKSGNQLVKGWNKQREKQTM